MTQNYVLHFCLSQNGHLNSALIGQFHMWEKWSLCFKATQWCFLWLAFRFSTDRTLRLCKNKNSSIYHTVGVVPRTEAGGALQHVLFAVLWTSSRDVQFFCRDDSDSCENIGRNMALQSYILRFLWWLLILLMYVMAPRLIIRLFDMYFLFWNLYFSFLFIKVKQNHLVWTPSFF